MNDDDKPLSAGGFSPPPATDSTPSGQDAPLSAAVFEPLSTASSGQQQAKWPWFLGALGGLIVLYGLFFLLTARSLDIVVDAVGPAEVQISGLVIPIGPRFLLRSGEYELTVTVPGYETYQDMISVSDAESQRLEVSPAIKPGWVTINSTPPGGRGRPRWDHNRHNAAKAFVPTRRHSNPDLDPATVPTTNRHDRHYRARH